jgi:hypothetical protein
MAASIQTFALPARLYRYRGLPDVNSLQLELEAIKQGYVYCAPYSEMNDPMEGVHIESAVLQHTPNYNRTLAKVRAAKERLGIASFSEAHRSEPMWAHYAGSFKGICVAYNFRKLSQSLSGGCFVRMVYNEEPPKLLANRSSPEDRARLALSSKTLRWAQEREWRLISDATGPVRYEDLASVTAIYLGSRIDPANKRAITKALAGSNVKVYRMRLDKYAIEFARDLIKLPG